MIRVFAITAVAVLAGCTGLDPRMPTAYKAEQGPHEIAVSDVMIRQDLQPRDLPLRISAPIEAGKYPVVVLSHGGGSSKDGYARVADHWASHGYVVIAPTHMDSRTLGFDVSKASGRAMAEVTLSRMKDVTFIATRLAEIAKLIPGLADKMDAKRLVAAGHSMGGGTALSATGLRLKNKRDGSVVAMDNPGFLGLILLSEPGRNPVMPDEPWRQVSLPTLVYTGTNDWGAVSDGTKSPFGYTFDGAPEVDNPARHYLWIDGVDHYMGGLWCCEGSKGPPDDVALRAFKGTTTAFLDAYAKNDNRAIRFLMEADLKPVTNGRATLSLK